jgi:DNA-binding response OmpR family regulator
MNSNGSFKVLVVDDDAALVRLMAVLLKTDGFEVTSALGGAEGLLCLDRERPDIIVLDLSMPEIDGRMFYRRAREAGYRGPVMICSAEGAQAAQRELAADGSIAKPFEPDYFVQSVNALLAGRNG